MDRVTDFELILIFRTVLLVIPSFVIMDVIAGFIALIVLAYYSSIKCDPLANGDISNLNMVRQLSYFFSQLLAVMMLYK